MNQFLCGLVLFVLVELISGQICHPDNCLLSNGCVCASVESPIEQSSTPQFVIVSFNDAITEINYLEYYEPLLSERTNPDGNPISATFYVPHEYTDYMRVNNLYNSGFEIAVHSVTKDFSSQYWQTASVETLIEEFQGQREIISKFANIPEHKIVGARVPNYELSGDRLFKAYFQSGIQYDNTWTTFNENPFFPFTLHYQQDVPCIFGLCPEESYEGLWASPIIDLIGNGTQCNNLQACLMQGSLETLSDWLYNQFSTIYETNRAPLTLIASAAWFQSTANSFDALADFLDRIAALDDVFLVSHAQVIEWMKNPVSASSYSSAIEQSGTTCTRRNCALNKGEEIRYMVSCVACPQVFPWLGNPQGLA